MTPRPHFQWVDPIRVGLDLVLPRTCPGCGGPDSWCAGCAVTVEGRPRLVRLPEATLDAASGIGVPPVYAIARYRGPVRAAILAGKERGRTDLPVALGAAVGRALLRLRRIGRLPEDVWIVPAPSRRSAARRRGGDPVTAMAAAAAGLMARAGVETGVAPCLFTTGTAQDSVGLDAAARATNLAGRIRFRPAAAPPHRAPVVLLDDVLTTGSTVLAAVLALGGEGIDVCAAVAVATAAPWLAAR